MAKQHLDKLMEEALSVASDKWARSGIDKAKQEVTVTTYNLKEAFKEAFGKSHQAEFKNNPVPFDKPDTVYQGAATAARNALIKHLDNPRSSSERQTVTPSKVIFSQEKYVRTPFTKMKKAGMKYIENELKKAKAEPLSDKQKETIQFGMQRLHQKNVTVGVGRLKKVVDTLLADENLIGPKFRESELFKTIQEKFGTVLANFKIEGTGDKEKLVYTGDVEILVQRKGQNYPGSEHGDWTKVKKFLEKELAVWLASKDLANVPGSRTIAQDATIKTTSLVMKNLTVGSFVKSATKIPSVKELKKKGDAEAKPKRRKNPKRATAQSIATKRVVKTGLASEPLRLIGLINRQLPDTVRKNMNAPALDNRTGRFAESVKITDVIKTPKGMPSFGYTYAKNPYQVYEMGQGTSPWATPERDPRTLIDRSIREIAAQFALGRFYTRRV